MKTLYNEPHQSLFIVENKANQIVARKHFIKQSIINFFFCLEGDALFDFGVHYQRAISHQKNYFFFNPEKDLSFTLKLSPHCKMVFLTISLEKLHELFIDDPLPFLKPENITQKFYDERAIPPNLSLELNQLFEIQLSDNASKLYYKGKILELLALYFSTKKPDTENCPFLKDQQMVSKIKNAKDYLLKNIEKAPTIKQLSKYATVNEYQLKTGFKEIYGKTIYSFLIEQKMNKARLLFDTKKFRVSEVAYQIGYSNTSHFIATFRKKFGLTPKKYLMAKN